MEIEEECPMFVERNLYTDLLMQAFADVNWEEIANQYLDAVEEEIEAQ